MTSHDHYTFSNLADYTTSSACHNLNLPSWSIRIQCCYYVSELLDSEWCVVIELVLIHLPTTRPHLLGDVLKNILLHDSNYYDHKLAYISDNRTSFTTDCSGDQNLVQVVHKVPLVAQAVGKVLQVLRGGDGLALGQLMVRVLAVLPVDLAVDGGLEPHQTQGCPQQSVPHHYIHLRTLWNRSS